MLFKFTNTGNSLGIIAETTSIYFQSRQVRGKAGNVWEKYSLGFVLFEVSINFSSMVF